MGDNPLAPLPVESGEYATRPRPTRIETDASTVRLIEYIKREDGCRTWELQYEASRRPRARVVGSLGIDAAHTTPAV